MDTLAFISRYEAILKEKKILKMQFYKDCGITDAAVSQWRTKKTKPAMTTISRIADYLGVSVGYLLGSDQKEKSPAPDGVGLDPETIELRDIWGGADKEEREALLAMARMLKARRDK